jgi:phosphatidylinositol glycan class T
MLIVGPIFLLLAYHLAIGFVHASPLEQFDEELNIKTLEDGKVATHFSFRTLLRGATPRHPATLGVSDVCALYLVR